MIGTSDQWCVAALTASPVALGQNLFSLKLLRSPYKFRLKVSTGCILHCLTLHGSLLEVLVHWFCFRTLHIHCTSTGLMIALSGCFCFCAQDLFCRFVLLSAFWSVCLADNVHLVAECILYCLLGRRAIHSGISCWYHSRLCRTCVGSMLKLMLTTVMTSQEFDLNGNSQTDVGK